MRKEEDYAFNVKAAYLAAFSHPLRLQIVELLRRHERSVGVISKTLGCAQPTVSKHLALLRQQGVVATRQSGVTVYYRLADRAILHVLKLVSAVLHKKLVKSQHLLAQLSKDLP
jgi:DNA-binding transcriptional ArsR family regulator